MQPTQIYLDPDQAARLDEPASVGGGTRLAMIREAIEQYLGREVGDDPLERFRTALDKAVGVAPYLPPTSRHAGELGRAYRQSHPGLGVVDLVVAATALGLNAELATSNVRHFPMFVGLEAPYPT